MRKRVSLCLTRGRGGTNLQAVDGVHVDMNGDEEVALAVRSRDDGSDLEGEKGQWREL